MFPGSTPLEGAVQTNIRFVLASGLVCVTDIGVVPLSININKCEISADQTYIG